MSLFERFRQSIANGCEKEAFLVGREGGYSVFYVPFEDVNPGAQLVLVGITPGPKQMASSYRLAQRLLRSGLSDEEILRRIKQACAFDGMRDRINEMLDHFGVAQCIGAAAAETLWSKNYSLFDATSVVPNAAFKGDAYFNGPFDVVLTNPLLRREFESRFIPSLEAMSGRAKYIGMGPVVDQGLSWCASAGVIDHEQILGYLPHASPASGSQFKYFMRHKRLEDLKPRDPVRRRVIALDAAYARMNKNVKKWQQSCVPA